MVGSSIISASSARIAQKAHSGVSPIIGPSGSVFLSAGTHAFEVQFFECCGVGLPSDASGVDLTLPAGVRYGFAGKVGDANCHGQSVSSLARQFGGLGPAAANLGFPNVQALQDAIKAYCGT
jgi:hypothetical protein